MAEVADSDILVHWLELDLSQRLVGKVYGVSPMPKTYMEWKALVEKLDTQQHCFDGIMAQQNPVQPNCHLPPPNCFAPPHAHSWPSHWPTLLPLPPCHIPPILVMPWWWIMPMPLECCIPASDVAKPATW